MNLLKNAKITLVSAATAAGTTDVVSTALDMTGFEGVVFFTTIGTANAGNYMKCAQDTDVGMGSTADLTGSKVTAASSGSVVALEVNDPLERFLQVTVKRGASTTVGEIYAIQYSGRKPPMSSDVTNVFISKSLVSPVEGTA